MRISVPYENGQIFQRFGHTPQFKFYDVDGGKIIIEQVVLAPAKKGHTVLAGFLKRMSVDVLICDRIGEGGQQALKAAGIGLYPGIRGNADHAVAALVTGNLPDNEVPAERPESGSQPNMPISFY